MNRLSSIIFTLLISLGMGLGGLAQQGPVSQDVLEQLVRRIVSLEQTVQELRAQLQSQTASEEGSSVAPILQTAQAMVPSPVQDTPINDRAKFDRPSEEHQKAYDECVLATGSGSAGPMGKLPSSTGDGQHCRTRHSLTFRRR